MSLFGHFAGWPTSESTSPASQFFVISFRPKIRFFYFFLRESQNLSARKLKSSRPKARIYSTENHNLFARKPKTSSPEKQNLFVRKPKSIRPKTKIYSTDGQNVFARKPESSFPKNKKYSPGSYLQVYVSGGRRCPFSGLKVGADCVRKCRS